MAFNLPVDLENGDGNHADIHNAANDAINLLEERIGPVPIAGAYDASRVPADVAPRLGRFDPRMSVYWPVGADLRKTRAKLAAVQAQVPGARCKIAWQGHSFVSGFGSSIGLNNGPVALRRMFESLNYLVGTGWVPLFCNVGSGATRDSRWSYLLEVGAWEYTGSAAGAGNVHFHLRASTAGAKARFVSDVPGTEVAIIYGGNSGAFTYSVDGAAAVTVTPTGASAFETATITGLEDKPHTVLITTSTATAVHLVAVSVRPRVAVEVAQFGISGTRASDHLPTLLWYNPFGVVDAYAPDCVVFQLEGNEALNGISAATFRTNANAILAAHDAAGRDIVIVNSPYAQDSESVYAQFRDVLYDLADTYGAPLVDLPHRTGSFATAQANGLMFDLIHYNAAGYGEAAQCVLAALTGGAVSTVAPTKPRDVIYAADNFARNDSGSAGSTEVGAYPWQARGNAVASIAANRLINTGGTAAEGDVYINDRQADGTLRVTLFGMATNNGVLFRSSSDADGYIFRRSATSTDWALARRTAPGVYTDIPLDVPTTGAVRGDVVEVVMAGQVVKLHVNGKLVHTLTDAVNTTKTQHGLWRFAAAAAISADNFTHTNRT